MSSINYLVFILIFKTKDILLTHFLGWVLTLCSKIINYDAEAEVYQGISQEMHHLLEMGEVKKQICKLVDHSWNNEGSQTVSSFQWRNRSKIIDKLRVNEQKRQTTGIKFFVNRVGLD